MKFINITGERYGRLVVIDRHKPRNGARWLCVCICDCGKQTIVQLTSLRSGCTKSCGCLQRDAVRRTKTKHGHALCSGDSGEYVSWTGLRDRCHRKNNKTFRYYGGRGIKVCSRWSNSFQNFLDDMGHKPSRSYTIERVDNDGDYCPENCKWATRKEQSINRRKPYAVKA